MRFCFDGTSTDPEGDRRKGADLARRGLQVAGEDPGVLANAALVLACFDEDIGTMMALVDRALVLNPSFARGWYISGILRTFAGQNDLAIEYSETSLRLSPRGRFGSVFNVIGGAYFLSRRFDEAVPKLLLAIQDNPKHVMSYRTLAACYAHMGRLDEAREVVARVRAITPLVVDDGMIYRDPEQRELYLSGLHLAVRDTS
jgi:adenylate cyclase